jgi:hypothetical protein
VLRALFRLLSLMDYNYSVVDSTKFTDWLRGLRELFINVRVKRGDTLFPVRANRQKLEQLLRITIYCLKIIVRWAYE